MEPPNLEWFATLGVGGIIAAFMFMFYRQDVAKFTKLWEEQAAQNRTVILQVMDVVRENTIALTKVVTTVDSLHRRLDGGTFNQTKIPHRDPRD